MEVVCSSQKQPIESQVNSEKIEQKKYYTELNQNIYTYI